MLLLVHETYGFQKYFVCLYILSPYCSYQIEAKQGLGQNEAFVYAYTMTEMRRTRCSTLVFLISA